VGARADLMAALVEEARKVRGGAYWVKRGYVNWAAFPFSTHPRAMTIALAEEDLIPTPGRERPIGETRGTLLFEVAARTPTGDEDLAVDDGLLEEFKDDVVEVLGALLARQSGGYPLSFGVFPDGANAAEWHDADEGTQGVTARVVVSF